MLTNNQVQEQLSNTIKAVGEDSEMSLRDKSLAIARLARAHIQCTRVTVYGSRVAIIARDKQFPNLANKLSMPVFRE